MIWIFGLDHKNEVLVFAAIASPSLRASARSAFPLCRLRIVNQFLIAQCTSIPLQKHDSDVSNGYTGRDMSVHGARRNVGGKTEYVHLPRGRTEAIAANTSTSFL